MTMHLKECFDTLYNLLGDVHMEYDLECDTINVINFNNSITLSEATRVHEELEKTNLKITSVYSNPKWYHILVTNNVFTNNGFSNTRLPLMNCMR
jgi:hypothetical protein